MSRNNPKLFQDPRIDYPTLNSELSFSNYIKQCKNIIANSRVDLNSENADLIIEANAPFEFKPEKNTKCGLLLIHGLFDSPFLLKDLGKIFCENNFLVRSVLLPGHGTVPGALLNIDFHDWIKTVKYGIESLKSEVEKIFLVGYSTGGSLALYEAARDPSIAGVIIITPPIKILSRFDFATNWHQAVSWWWDRAKWFFVTKEIDYAKYQSIPFNAAYQVYKLSEAIKTLEKNAWEKCPTFFVLVHDDEVICTRSALQFFQTAANPQSKLLYYTNQEEQFDDPRIEIRSSKYPEFNITGFSHVGITNSPTNFHYGLQGDFIKASHPNKNCVYDAENKFNSMLYSFLYQIKLTKLKYCTLSFNPDFEHMAKRMTEFLNN